MSLAALIKKGGLRGIATATPATLSTGSPETIPSVAKVATVAVAIVPGEAANDPPLAPVAEGSTRTDDASVDRGQWNWSNDPAMSRRDADTFIHRRALFLEKGQNLEDAERFAHKLAIRDREGDDRHLCLECSYYGSTGRCVAAAIGRLPGASELLEPVPVILQRCEAFWSRWT